MADSGKEIRTRCHHCAGPLTKNLETNEWTVAPFIRIGSAVGGTASAFIGFNHVTPIVRKWIIGPMWLHFLVGVALYRLGHSLHRRLIMGLFIHPSHRKGKKNKLHKSSTVSPL